MSSPWENGGVDPDYRSGVQSGVRDVTAWDGKRRPRRGIDLGWLGEALTAPGNWLFENVVEPLLDRPGGEGEDRPKDLPTEIAEAYEDWHGREPDRDGGANVYGAEVAVGGTPRVTETTARDIERTGTPVVGMPVESIRTRTTRDEPVEAERMLQEALESLGFDVGGVDGYAGPATIAALNEFLESIGLSGRYEVGDEIPDYVIGLLRQELGN